VYLEDEEKSAALPPKDEGPPTARFHEGIEFDDSRHVGNASFTKHGDMTLEKLND
jgi:hypothetical protein